ATNNFRVGFQSLNISKSLTEELRKLAARQGATLRVTLFAAFAVLLHRYTQENDIVIGSIMEGRNLPEVQGSLGCFFNPVVLRADLSGNPKFQEFVRCAHEINAGACAHSDLP